MEEAVKTADHIAGLSQVVVRIHKSQQLMLLKLTILIILLQIAVAIAKESTNAASELTLREGLRFEKRMFQV